MTRTLLALVRTGVALTLTAMGPSAAAAVQTEGGTSDAVPAPAKVLEARHVEVGAVRVDGRLDDAAWQEATFDTGFRQKGKDRSFAPRAATAVAILYDAEAIYVGVRMAADPQTTGSRAVGARDDGGNVERVLVSFDTYRDRRTAFTFGVTAGGGRLDYVDGRDNEGWRDDSYDPVWEARVWHHDEGWQAELRIPFSQLRFSPGAEQIWGMNVRRWNPANFLNLYWVAVPYEETGWVSRFGELRGLQGIRAGPRVEVVPYALERRSWLEPRDGAPGASERSLRVGGDLKAGLGPNLTLEATANPDFGQVEADPARVNLTAFETFFPERRPFFLEGRELFRTRGPSYFYSRRIGSVPRLGGATGVVEDVQETSVLGGAKLTGRLPGGLSTGVLAALTDRERVPGLPGSDPVEVAPRTAFVVGRLEQEVGAGGSSVGVMGTAVERFMSQDGQLPGLLPTRALAGGADWVVRAGEGRYEFSGFVGGSRVVGSAEALARLQASSTHYFQRPDQDHVTFDGSATALTGWAAGLTLGRIAGGEWRWELMGRASSPGFEIRDAGSQPRADVIEARVGLSRSVRRSQGTLRNHAYGVGLTGAWNFGGIRRQTSPSAFLSTTWANLWTTYVEAGMNLRALSDDLTRGGPLMEAPRSWWASAELAGPRTGGSWWSIRANGFQDEFRGWSTGFSGGLTMLAGRRLELSFLGGGSLGDDSRLFLAAVEGGPSETFGTRYVFSGMERREYFLQARTRLALTPDAILTLYAEPFVSTGGIHDPGELTAARARTLRPYGADGTTLERLEDGAWQVTDGEETFRIENYDFWVRSFRATAVFRWEWWRGSSLHLIWQRNGWRFDPRFGGADARALGDALRDPGQDVVAAKVSILLRPR